jgi:NADH:ubiquinone oxidoreductase subunit F (NADH-binding)
MTGSMPGLPLLTRRVGPSLERHLAQWGPTRCPPDLLAEVGRVGIVGRGGGGFPLARKLAAVRSAADRSWRRPVIVANGCEGEPLSVKDEAVLRCNPHLVIDGMVAAARAVGADEGVLCIEEGFTDLDRYLRAVLDERRDPLKLRLVVVPAAYVAGQETAVVNWLNHRRPVPTTVPPRPAERGVGRAPTLVSNVETLADLALVSRFGSSWWAGLGAGGELGSMLVTVSGAVHRPGVRDVPLGTSLPQVLAESGAEPSQGVLVGGYSGTWLTPAEVHRAVMSTSGLAPYGARPGSGVVAVIPRAACPVAEVTRVIAWLASQSVGQCGPCRHGLPALAWAWSQLLHGESVDHSSRDVLRWSAMVRERGACSLPDGAAVFASSALRVFADHLELHRGGQPCPYPPDRHLLPTPTINPLGLRAGGGALG